MLNSPKPCVCIALDSVKRRLVPIETDPHQRAIDEAVAHVVELGAQQPEQQEDPASLGDLFGKGRRNRCRQQQWCLRSQDLGDDRMERDPPVDEFEKGSVEGQGDGSGNQATPQERRNEQPRCLAFPPVEKPQNRDRNQGEQARQEKSDKKHEGDFRRHPNEEDDLNQRRICQHQQQGCADRKACSATAHGRAHQEAIISGMCDQDRAISLPSVT